VFASRFAIALVVAIVFMVGAIVTVNYVIDTKLDSVDRVNVATAEGSAKGGNFLVIGSDTRAFIATDADEKAFGGDEGGQRSDTMMVVHVEPDAKRTLVVSFPRDLWVDIPGVGMSKINAAFNSGPDKVIATLKENFGIDINHFVEVDFKSFRGIVDAIGSVPVYLPYPARDEKTGLYVPVPGCVSLNGKAALAYARSRGMQYYSMPKARWLKADAVPDIDRIKRQQEFLRRLVGVAVAQSLNDPITANDVAGEVLKNLTIDDSLSKNDIFALIDAFRSVNPNDSSALEFQTLPWENGPTQHGLSVLYAKDPDWRSLVARLGGRKVGRGTTTTTPGSTTPGSTTPGSTTPGSTTATSVPTTTSTTRASTAPGGGPEISNQSQLGQPVPLEAPCTAST
jgi:LCP family protein required for cell wall assembly